MLPETCVVGGATRYGPAPPALWQRAADRAADATADTHPLPVGEGEPRARLRGERGERGRTRLGEREEGRVEGGGKGRGNKPEDG